MKKKNNIAPIWNLGLLYSSPLDAQIEKDMEELEQLCANFQEKYDTAERAYQKNEDALFNALSDFEKIMTKSDAKPFLYFYFLRDIEAQNGLANAQISLLQNRLAKCENSITFFKISLGTIPGNTQRQFLSNPKLARYRIFLKRIFDDAQYMLSVEQEKIINLKSLPAVEMWVSGNEKMLNQKTVLWKGKHIPLSQALNNVQNMPSTTERRQLSAEISKVLMSVAPFSEAEINAVITNKKIDDELRGFVRPYESTVLRYRNDPAVIERLVRTVTSKFSISHRFYEVKRHLLKQRDLYYCDRSAKIGNIRSKFSFEDTADILKQTFGSINRKFADIIDEYISNRQIDVPPRVGKRSGAYCAGTYENPTFILLNHTDDYHSFTTFAHEIGHAFHGELSRIQGPLYSDYSTSLAETASTLFESIARDAIFDKLPEKEKIVALHDKINDDVATVFRQIACFNFENDIHSTIRAKGFMSAQDLANSHNRHMSAYLGPRFKLTTEDGYFFVHWSHIRRFFYVYSYAYGMLVSKALLRKYRKDPLFWKSIEQFLSAGGKLSPEEILNEIGIDTSSPGFFEEGLQEIEDDIIQLEKLTGFKNDKNWKR